MNYNETTKELKYLDVIIFGAFAMRTLAIFIAFAVRIASMVGHSTAQWLDKSDLLSFQSLHLLTNSKYSFWVWVFACWMHAMVRATVAAFAIFRYHISFVAVSLRRCPRGTHQQHLAMMCLLAILSVIGHFCYVYVYSHESQLIWYKKERKRFMHQYQEVKWLFFSFCFSI